MYYYFSAFINQTFGDGGGGRWEQNLLQAIGKGIVLVVLILSFPFA